MAQMIYLDHNATTPVLSEVLDAMVPYLTAEWGNPSSAYKFGSKLKSVIATAREQVAELIGAHSMDVIFTSCATESNNAAIAAALRANPAKRHIVTSQVEHSSVLNCCMALEKSGTPLLGRSGDFTSPPESRDGVIRSSNGGLNPPLREGAYRATYLPVDREGMLKLADLEAAITDQTASVSLMWANNETGVLFPDTGLNGHKTQRIANTTNISSHGIESEALLILLDKEGICASSGSACLADSDEPSHVIKAMKPNTADSRQMIRFSLDAATTQEQRQLAVTAVKREVEALSGVIS
jgi:cysteine sulfinate desulfinase/cysteine desulfurase-like protein